jgi:hypothetical protein
MEKVDIVFDTNLFCRSLTEYCHPVFHCIHDLTIGDQFALKGSQPVVLVELATHLIEPAVGRFRCEILAKTEDASVCKNHCVLACVWMFGFFDYAGIADDFECIYVFHISMFCDPPFWRIYLRKICELNLN